MQIELKPLPPAEMLAYFRSKGFAPRDQRFDYRDHWREDHARAFVVAKAMRDDVAGAIRDELDRAFAEGRTIEQFKADLKPRLVQLGWWGRSLERDPLTGELAEVQLGSMRRLRTIFDTNMRTAHAAGQWARIQRTKVAFPYLQYIQIERPTKRHDHERFHDQIWRVDDPIWLRIYPPNGYFCGCTVIQRTERWMLRNGRTVSPPLDLDEEPWTNKRTGEVQMVPRGVNAGFDSNPGAAWLDIAHRVDDVMPDLGPAQRGLARGQLQGLRLRRLGIGRETLIVSDETGAPVAMMDAPPEAPEHVSVDRTLETAGAGRPDRAQLLHSHLTDAALSREDFALLQHPMVQSVTAVSPGGALWRARVAQVPLTTQIAEFARAGRAAAGAELDAMAAADRAELVQHALGLFLEKRGVIHYTYSLTDRLRQLFARYADLIERLS